ncbi:MAG: glycosyltransferase family 4 protein [Chitinophagales bacterium]|nr:glycosyltransferase family 4 protein [Chitinophagales bacterium]MDW8274234.1 glycosyltransferase family 4 protein [Chitinophagales bacterium]
MRVLILLDAFSLGGAEKQALLFANWLQNTKQEIVEVWAFMPGDGSAKAVCDRYGIKTRVIGYFRGLARYLYPLQIRKYSKLFNEFKPDVLMGYTNQPNLLLGLVWKHTTAKTFIWGQQGIEAAGYAFSKKADRIAISNTPYFISNSINGANFLKQELKIPEEKVLVVYNGPEPVQPLLSRQEWRHKLGLKDTDFVALMVAHIALRKDHDTAIDAWKIVVERLLPENIVPVLLFAGIFGDATQRLFQKVIDNNLYPYIKFLGNVQDIAGLNLASDIHLLSSHTEGLPNSLLEAMYHSLPVVGTDIPGIREALGDENNDFLVKPKDPADLAEKVIRLAKDMELRRQIGAKNKLRIEKHFKLDEMCRIHYEIMQKEVLAK